MSSLSFLKYVMACAALSVASALSAQDFPALGKASDIETGALPNGIRYYIVTNPGSGGFADYALVQKEAVGERKSREALLELPHFHNPSPYMFLASKGVSYKERGFVRSEDGSNIFRFEDVPTSDQAAADSTLMMIFDLCTLSGKEQAIIISGDVSADNIKGKMSIFSMMIPHLETAENEAPYHFEGSEDLTLMSMMTSTSGAAAITIEYAIPRTPRKYLNTIQSYVTEMLYGELGILLERRISASFLRAGVPLADIATVYQDASAGNGDEMFSISMHVAESDLVRATEIVSDVLADIDMRGVQPDELDSASKAYINRFAREVCSGGVSNAAWLDRCIASYLYGTRLSSSDEQLKFLKSKDMGGERNVGIFTRFASALLDPQRNLTLIYETPGGVVPEEELASAFREAWSVRSGVNMQPQAFEIGADTLWNSMPRAPKVKLKSEDEDPISGGAMWTFSNGAKVVYKQIPGAADFHYALFSRGGYPYIKGLGKGEGAFVSDLFSAQRIAGMDQAAMAAVLDEKGVVLKREVGISDTRVYGNAPVSELDFVLKTLVAMATDAEPHACNMEYFKPCEQIHLEFSRLEEDGVRASVDSIMRPDYMFSQYRYMSNLSDGLADKTAAYTASRLSKLGDGMLVIVGGVERETLLGLLQKRLGALSVGRTNPPRPQGQYRLRTGWSTYQVRSDVKSEGEVFVSVSAMTPVTMERYIAGRIVEKLIARALTEALSDYGMYAEVSNDIEVFPQERMTVSITCRASRSSGLPAGISPVSPDQAVQVIRKAVDDVTTSPVKDSDLAICKSILSKDFAIGQSRQASIMNAVIMRYSEGKDFSTRYKDVLNSLNASDIQDLFSVFAKGSKVEYIVY